jgi:hypothetical protein
MCMRYVVPAGVLAPGTAGEHKRLRHEEHQQRCMPTQRSTDKSVYMIWSVITSAYNCVFTVVHFRDSWYAPNVRR